MNEESDRRNHACYIFLIFYIILNFHVLSAYRGCVHRCGSSLWEWTVLANLISLNEPKFLFVRKGLIRPCRSQLWDVRDWASWSRSIGVSFSRPSWTRKYSLSQGSVNHWQQQNLYRWRKEQANHRDSETWKHTQHTQRESKKKRRSAKKKTRYTENKQQEIW